MRISIGTFGAGVLAVTLAVLPLAGCSSSQLFGEGSRFGSSQDVASDVGNLDNMSSDTALTQARAHFRNADFGYSAQLYKHVVEVSPKNPEGYIGLSASYDRLGRFDLSDRVYASLYELTGGTAQYYNNLGYSYLLRGNVPSALTNFRKAIKLDPNNLVVANNMQIVANATSGA